MFGSLRRSSFLAMAAALFLGASSAPVLATQPAMTSAAPWSLDARRFAFAATIRGIGRYGRKGAGITMAQQQRGAAKKRSVARNRRHHR